MCLTVHVWTVMKLDTKQLNVSPDKERRRMKNSVKGASCVMLSEFAVCFLNAAHVLSGWWPCFLHLLVVCVFACVVTGHWDLRATARFWNSAKKTCWVLSHINEKTAISCESYHLNKSFCYINNETKERPLDPTADLCLLKHRSCAGIYTSVHSASVWHY